MDDDVDAPLGGVTASIRLSWQNLSAIVLSGVGAALEELAGIPEALACLLLADRNYAEERRAFHEDAALEIETLTQEE